MQAGAVLAWQAGGFTVESTNPPEASNPLESTNPLETSKPLETSNPLEASNPLETSKPLEMLGWADNEAELREVSRVNTWWYGCCQECTRKSLVFPNRPRCPQQTAPCFG